MKGFFLIFFLPLCSRTVGTMCLCVSVRDIGKKCVGRKCKNRGVCLVNICKEEAL